MKSDETSKGPTLRLSVLARSTISNNSKEEIPELELLREYRRVQLALGHPPSSTELTKFGKYHASTYTRRYGSWARFRAAVNNPISPEITRQKMIENYYRVKERLGRIPTGRELGALGDYAVRTYHKYFGGHQRLLELLRENKEDGKEAEEG